MLTLPLPAARRRHLTLLIALALALVLATCAAPAVAPSPTATPTVASATATATASAAAAVTSLPAGLPPIFAASECTSATATTRQVIERYLALSTSNNPQAVLDCFATVWREKNATGVNVNNFADFAAAWSKAGPVTNVTIRFVDTVNGCDRFGVGAQLANPSAVVYQVPPFFSVGPEAGRMRIYEESTGLPNASATTLHCP
jgi:hypothetical protein